MNDLSYKTEREKIEQKKQRKKQNRGFAELYLSLTLTDRPIKVLICSHSSFSQIFL